MRLELARQLAPQHAQEYPEDIARLVQIAKDYQLQATPEQLALAWQLHSLDYYAQWHVLGREDDEIAGHLGRWLYRLLTEAMESSSP